MFRAPGKHKEADTQFFLESVTMQTRSNNDLGASDVYIYISNTKCEHCCTAALHLPHRIEAVEQDQDSRNGLSLEAT